MKQFNDGDIVVFTESILSKGGLSETEYLVEVKSKIDENAYYVVTMDGSFGNTVSVWQLSDTAPEFRMKERNKKINSIINN